MRRCLAVQPSGFYAWQKSPLSRRARQPWRQAVPGSRQHAVPPVRRRCARPGLGGGHHLHSHPGRLRLSGGSNRSASPPRGGLVDAEPTDHRCVATGAAHGGMAAQAEATGADPLRPGLAVHQHGVGRLYPGSQSCALDELRQLATGQLILKPSGLTEWCTVSRAGNPSILLQIVPLPLHWRNEWTVADRDKVPPFRRRGRGSHAPGTDYAIGVGNARVRHAACGRLGRARLGCAGGCHWGRG